jgi:hypothetical protein
MEYVISRTSLWDDERPCDEAYLAFKPSYQISTYSEEEYDIRFAEQEGGKWREKGSEHSVTEDGCICRRMRDVQVWCVKIDTLDEMNAFAQKYGQIILKERNQTLLRQIEIYDDYRE